jgi:hypothetical protein
MKVGIPGSGPAGQTPGAGFVKHGESLLPVALGTVVDKVIELANPENFAGTVLVDAANPLADAPPVNQWTHAFKVLTR